MSADVLPYPDKPLTVPEVIERWPTLRQSLLADFDDCALYAYFGMRYTQGWSTHPQARGTIFHRTAAEILRTMQIQKANQVPVGVALATLEEVLEQRGVPWKDRVRLPLREIPVLRMAVAKFAKDNRFTTKNIIDVEKRLEAPMPYVEEGTGELIERRLTGMPDAIVLDPKHPQDGVIVLDWKATWALPPKREAADRDAAENGLSYEGYFQQRFYAWLILKNYPAINVVTLREFYVYRSKPREATITRAQLERIEEELANVTREFDLAVGYGKPKVLRYPYIQKTPWEPSPGKHCYYCPLRHHCPIDDEVLNAITIQSPDQARKAIGILERSEAVSRQIKEAARPYAELHGPIESYHSKGRRVWGPRTNSAGKPEFTFFAPKESDRAPHRVAELDKPLEDALRRAAEEQRGDGDGESVAA